MIALCREHHDEADQGLFSVEQLRSLKNTPKSTQDVKGDFPSWSQPNLLVRIGGSYVGGSRAVIAVAGEPIITLTRDDQAMLSLSFTLRDEAGNVVVAMRENAFEAYPRSVHDLTVAARKKSVKVWLGGADIGLDVMFDRISLEALDGRLAEDRAKAMKSAARLMEAQLKDFPSEIRTMIEEACDPTQCGDIVRQHILAWVHKNCLDDEGKIPFLDFRQLAIYFHGQRITIKNSIGNMLYCAVCGCDRAVNLPCPCPACVANRVQKNEQ
jgi:hypothetical protein